MYFPTIAVLLVFLRLSNKKKIVDNERNVPILFATDDHNATDNYVTAARDVIIKDDSFSRGSIEAVA